MDYLNVYLEKAPRKGLMKMKLFLVVTDIAQTEYRYHQQQRYQAGRKKKYQPNIQIFLCSFPFIKYSVLLSIPSPLYSPQIHTHPPSHTFNFFKKSASKTLCILLVQLLGKWSGECISYLN